MQTTIEVTIMCQEQRFKSRNKEEDDEVKPSTHTVMSNIGDYNWSF